MPGRSEEGISEHRRSQNRESQRRFRQRQRERNAAEATKQETQRSKRHPRSRITTNAIQTEFPANLEDHLTTQDWLASLHAQGSTALGGRDGSDQPGMENAKTTAPMANLPSPFSPLSGIESNHWPSNPAFGIFGSPSEDVTSPQFEGRCFSANDPGNLSGRTPRLGLSQRPIARTVYSDPQRHSVDFHTDGLPYPSAGQLAMRPDDHGVAAFDWLSGEEDARLFTPKSDGSHRSGSQYVGRETSSYGDSSSDQHDPSRITQPEIQSSRPLYDCRCGRVQGSNILTERNPFEQKVNELLDLLSSVYKAGVSMSYLSSDPTVVENIEWLRTRMDMAPPKTNVIDPLQIPLGDSELERDPDV